MSIKALSDTMFKFAAEQHLADYAKAAGVDISLQSLEQCEREIENDPAYGQALAKLGAAIYKEAGMEDAIGYSICLKVAAARDWYPEYLDLVLPVETVLARRNIQEKLAGEGDFLSGMGTLGGKFMSSMPASFETLLLGSILAGGGAGALKWHLTRGVQEEEDDNQAIRAKIRAYRNLAGEIDSEISQRAQGFKPVLP